MKRKNIKILTVLAFLSTALLTSCGGSKESFHDYVNDVKLTVDYANRDFLRDGIGEVTLQQTIDGDTAHFKTINLNDGKPHDLKVKARFLGVNTPESTSSIEPWGKAASKFTSDKLNEATKIVLSSSFTVDNGGTFKDALIDSYGRSLAFVWVTTAENPTLDDFKLLNLWLVQESYSGAKGLSDVGSYEDYFTKADIQASKGNLRIYSKEPDPDFNYGDASVCSILDIFTKIDEDTGMSIYNGQKITTIGVVTRVINNSAYIQMTYEPDETNELEEEVTKGIYVFSNSSIEPMSTIGNKIEITATLSFSDFTGNYQLSGVLYDQWSDETKNNTRVLETDINVEPVVVTSAEQLPSLDGVFVQVDDLYPEAGDKGGYGGKHEWNKTTDSYNTDNDMSIYCNIGSDGSDNKTALRIDGAVNIKDTEHPGNNVQSYKYFTGGTTYNEAFTYKRKKVSVLGICEKYVTSSGRETYQIKLCHNRDILETTIIG